MTRISLHKLVFLVLLTVLAAAPAAHADGDPASDYLLSQQTFLSPNARISSSDTARLNALVTAARQRGYTIRVAVIQSSYDLGAVTSLDKKPRLYAHFLSQELRFVYKQRLLVVMPNGFGIADDGNPAPAEQAVLDGVSPAGTLDGSALVGAAINALRALTAHAGVPIAATSSSNDTTTRLGIVIGSAVVFILLVAGGRRLTGRSMRCWIGRDSHYEKGREHAPQPHRSRDRRRCDRGHRRRHRVRRSGHRLRRERHLPRAR